MEKARKHCDAECCRNAKISFLLDKENYLPRDSCQIQRRTLDEDSLQKAAQAAWKQSGQTSQRIDNDPRQNEKTAPLTQDKLIQALLPGARDCRRRLFITGEGGMGKTELTRLITLRFAEYFLSAEQFGIVPFRFELKDLVKPGRVNRVEDLEHSLGLPDWIKSFARAGRVAFILDGLDEIQFERAYFCRALKNFIDSEAHRNCTFILAGRPGCLDPSLSADSFFDAKNQHVLQPLTDRDMRNYVNGYFSHVGKPKLGPKLLGAVGSNRSSLYPLIQTPLMLAFACDQYLTNRSLSSNPAELIESGLERVFDRRRTTDSHVLSPELPINDVCFEALSALAAFVLVPKGDTDPRIGCSRDEALGILFQNKEHISAAGLQISVKETECDPLLRRLVPASGILAWTNNKQVTFTNRVIAEYLAARWIVWHGYPNWPYQRDPYTPHPNPDAPAEKWVECQVLDFLGDFVWTNHREGLVQAVRFELGRQPSGRAILLRVTRWMLDTANVFRRDADRRLDIKRTLLFRIAKVFQAFTAEFSKCELEAANAIVQDVLNVDTWWFNDKVWRDSFNHLPAALREPYFANLRYALKEAIALLKASPRQISHQALRAIAEVLAGDPVALEAVAETFAEILVDPMKNAEAAGSLLEVIIAGFGGNPTALKMLTDALDKVVIAPVKGRLTYISFIIAHSFAGDPAALGALSDALAKVIVDPMNNGFVIRELSGDIVRGFGGDPAALKVLTDAFDKVIIDPVGNEAAIECLSWSIATGFAGNRMALNKLTQALTNVLVDPVINRRMIEMLLRVIDKAFAGDPIALEAVADARSKIQVEQFTIRLPSTASAKHSAQDRIRLKAMTEALGHAVSNPLKNRAGIRAYSQNIAIRFARDPVALKALTDALQKVLVDPVNNGDAIESLSTAIVAGFTADHVALKALIDALNNVFLEPAKNVDAIKSLLKAFVNGFKGDPIASKALTDAYANVVASPLTNGDAIRWLSYGIAYGFAGSLNVAAMLCRTDEFERINSNGEAWQSWVVLVGTQVQLEDNFLKFWGLPADPPIMQLLDGWADPYTQVPRRAVVVAPREKIRRGLPASELKGILKEEGYFHDSDDLTSLVRALRKKAELKGEKIKMPYRHAADLLQALLFLERRNESFLVEPLTTDDESLNKLKDYEGTTGFPYHSKHPTPGPWTLGRARADLILKQANVSREIAV